MPDIEDISLNKISDNDYQTYEQIVKKLFDFVIKNKDSKTLKSDFVKKYQQQIKTNKIQLKKKTLISVYKNMIENRILPHDPFFWKCIQKKPIRNHSGVNPVTLMYSNRPNGNDFTCRFKCKYCQQHPDFPKSYGPEAPACARGFNNDFDSIRQMNSNLNRLYENGHEVDKLELNLEGGTFSEFPQDYIRDFHRDAYYAANVWGTPLPHRARGSLADEIIINETANVHIIGVTIETRPDTIDNEQIKFFRELGVTRVQIGVQHTDSRILKMSARGHDYSCAVKATDMLKTNGFKVVHHYMLSLPYATPEKDLEMLDIVYHSTDGRPHEIKIYPYSVVDYSPFKEEYDEGKFDLYTDTQPTRFIDVMSYALLNCPRDIRICRAVRDIPTKFIHGGCMTPNLRQIATQEIEKAGNECQDIRSREVGRRPGYKLEDAVYNVTYLNLNDIIIMCESPDGRALFGYLRLRSNNYGLHHNIVFPEINNHAIIEELHVYSTEGMLVKVGEQKAGSSQHCGVGKHLVKEAECLAHAEGYNGILVISGFGVRGYYKKLGYNLDKGEGQFMIKTFWVTMDDIIGVILFIVFAITIITSNPEIINQLNLSSLI